VSLRAPEDVKVAGASERVKPRLRGRLHQIALYLAIPAGLALLIRAEPGRARVAAAIYAVTLLLLYAISSTYHVHEWNPTVRMRWRRADRATIYVFIAGSYTPVCLLVLHGPMRIGVLIGVWLGAFLGVAAQVSRRLSRYRMTHALYIVLGWLVIVGAPQLVHGLSGAQLALLAGGGLLYTVGSVVLATKRPDPVPTVFGYHEVWHTMVVAACVCHYVLIWQLVA
jgi:hemolysin III